MPSIIKISNILLSAQKNGNNKLHNHHSVEAFCGLSLLFLKEARIVCFLLRYTVTPQPRRIAESFLVQNDAVPPQGRAPGSFFS
jgi:hypothetical protein